MVVFTTLFVLQGVVGLFLQWFRGWEINDFAERSVFWAFFYSLFLVSALFGTLLIMFIILP